MSTSNSDQPPKRESLPNVQIYLNQKQFEQLRSECRQTGRTNMSAYLRARLGLDRKILKIDSLEVLKTLDKVGTEVARISDNMDKVTRYTDDLARRGEFDSAPVEQFNLLMEKYITKRKELVKAYRAVIRMI